MPPGKGRQEAIERRLKHRADVDMANEVFSQRKRDRHDEFVRFQNSLPPGGSKSVKAQQYKRQPGKTVKIRKKSLSDKLAQYWDDTIQGV